MYNTAFHNHDISKFSFLVTGGAGFIGSNIVEYLIRYEAGKVRILDNLLTSSIDNISEFITLPNVEFINGDIRDQEVCRKACEGIDYITHQAALGSVPRSVKNPVATHDINASGFLNVLIAARDARVKRFVYASSSSVYGDHPGLPKLEDQIGNPLSPYAVSKRTNELYASVFANTYNMEIIGLRYFNVFGPKQSPEGAYAAVIPLFIDSVINDSAPGIDGDGEQTRDFTFVENAVQANILAMFTENKDALNQIYNVAVGENFSVNQLFRIITDTAGSKLKAEHKPTRPGDIRNSLADISKAEELLQYKPAVRLEEGLKITFDWFRSGKK
ncbi:MAG: NAD-dependent epimerase/dehydratase family protein [Bacteroidetes bacterium]|nr:MAG: NAD-dependent epimerase/dehydratase family protein [Bacteroidota bacterium]REK05156.1 MAG: NAD-dependent epimerase/dehydratase family protein [Bacteroidota bacterium]REK32561.1 MAG: NAD-dependent epimerase/dehydratase family protein [Bacteroidota bacterium]REK48992.1 MAG: NAD-dependent epimerase/dehydratase family protein [Bacteroidota bacterium]